MPSADGLSPPGKCEADTTVTSVGPLVEPHPLLSCLGFGWGDSEAGLALNETFFGSAVVVFSGGESSSCSSPNADVTVCLIGSAGTNAVIGGASAQNDKPPDCLPLFLSYIFSPFWLNKQVNNFTRIFLKEDVSDW